MVDVITPQVRSQAQRGIRDVGRQQSTLTQRQRQLSTPAFLRTLTRESRLVRADTLKAISGLSSQLRSRSSELLRISKLPTAQEFIKEQRGRIQNIRNLAIKFGFSDLPLEGLDKESRELARSIREGQSDSAILALAQRELQQTLLPEQARELVGAIKAIQSGATLTEVQLQQTLLPEFRALPIADVTARQTLLRQTPITTIRTELAQTLAPVLSQAQIPENQRDRIIRIVSQTFKKGITNVKKAEEDFSNKLKQLGLTDETISGIARVGTRSPFIPSFVEERLEKEVPILKAKREFEEGFVTGVITGARDEPIKTGVTLASFLALPRLLTLSAKVLKARGISQKFAEGIPALAKELGKIALTRGLATAYIGVSGLQIASEPDARARGVLIGRKTTTEVLPFIVGTRLGVKGDLKLQIRQEFKKELAKLPEGKKAAFEDYIKQAELLGRFEPTAKNIEFDRLERLPPKGRRALREFLKENDVIVGGSVAQTSQVNVGRPLNDVDGYHESLSPRDLAIRLATKFREAGVERVSVTKGDQVTIAGKKIAEFHNIDRLLKNIAEVTPLFVPARRYIIKTPEGIRIQRIALQIRRKAVAGLADPKRLATGKYKKDLQDLKKITDQLFKRAELNARSSFFFKESRLRELEKQFGVKLPRPEAPSLLKVTKKFKKPTPSITKPLKVGEGIFREPPIISRVKAKKNIPFGTRKPSQVKIKIKKPFVTTPSQKPFKPKKPKFPIKPSQPPTKFPPTRVPPPFTPPPTKFPPSQPPFKFPPPRFPPPFTPPPPPPPPGKVPPPFAPPKKPPITPPPKKPKFGARVRPLGKPSGKQPGYKAFFKKGKSFRPISNVPVLKRIARDQGAFIIDRSLARTFRIRKVKRPAQKPIVTVPKGYFQRTRQKYRAFKKRKGVKIGTPNQFIEKRKFALDTGTEVRRIQAARLIAIQRRKFFRKVKPLIGVRR